MTHRDPQQTAALFHEQTVSGPIVLHGESSTCLAVTPCEDNLHGIDAPNEPLDAFNRRQAQVR